MLASTRAVVGVHGSAFINVIFAPLSGGAALIEIGPMSGNVPADRMYSNNFDVFWMQASASSSPGSASWHVHHP